MWVRSGYWVGTPLPGMEDRFREVMDGQIVPIMRTLPGVRSAKVLWPKQREDGPPAIACQVLLEFATRADVATMIASQERVRMREHVQELKKMFDGSLSHIEFEAT